MTAAEQAGRRTGSALPVGLVAHLGEIISVVAPDGTVLSVNQESVNGATATVGQDAHSFVHPEDQHTVAERTKRHLCILR